MRHQTLKHGDVRMSFLSQVFRTAEAFAPVIPPLIKALEGGNQQESEIDLAAPSQLIDGPNGLVYWMVNKKIFLGNFSKTDSLSFSHTQPIFKAPDAEPSGYESESSVIPPRNWADVTEDFQTYTQKEAMSTYATQAKGIGQEPELTGILTRTFSASMAALATGATYALKNGTLIVNYSAKNNQVTVQSAIPPLNLDLTYQTDSGQIAQARLSWSKPPELDAEAALQPYIIDLPVNSDSDGVLRNLCLSMQYSDSGSTASDLLMGEERKSLITQIPEEVLSQYESISP